MGITSGPINLDDWAVGNTRVFVKDARMRNMLEILRNNSLKPFIVKIQAFFRGSLSRLATMEAKLIQVKRKKDDQKRQEAEKQLMAIEDLISQETRRIQKEEEERQRQERERIERERVSN